MNNVNVVVKPGETVNDIIEQICQSEKLGYDDPFAFSAICTKSKKFEDHLDLKINCIEPRENNPFTPLSLIVELFQKEPRENNIRYINPPLEQYLTIFRPMLFKMVSKAYPAYQALIPEREELLSILFFSIVKLNNKGYYLHNHLIYKTFINELNKEVRKLKNFTNIVSLDAPVDQEDGRIITLGEQVIDKSATEIARQQMQYTEKDHWEDMFNAIKSAMLQDMSQLSFDRILIQLKSKTIDTQTSRLLSKYRDIFNPGYVPRPNARRK